MKPVSAFTIALLLGTPICSTAEVSKDATGSDCTQAKSTELFDVALLCTDRKKLRAAVRSKGGIPRRENSRYWYDVYQSTRLLRGSHKLVIGYTINRKFAHAKYTFKSFMDRWQVDRIRDMVSSKYGKPHKSIGQSKLGSVEYKWNLKDGIVIKVYRGWPDTTTYISYEYPENLNVLEQEIRKNHALTRGMQFKKQSSNF